MHIKRNEEGLTLLEVLATTILVSIVLILLFNIFGQGQKTYVKSSESIRLEQETQLILETIRKKHFHSNAYTLLVEDKVLKVNSIIISEGFDYTITIGDNILPNNSLIKIDSSYSTLIDIKLSKNDQNYNVRTVLERWR